ncbi:Transcription factor [Aspergillus sp. HF37]|nr:Transcription factor [Aspergillus sp. HF37]
MDRVPPRRLAPASSPPGSRLAMNRNPLPKRGNTKMACSECKTRKQRCRGGPPCENCVKAGSECVVDETTDKRRKVADKRKVADLEDKESLLFDLVRILRHSDSAKSAQLLDLIRSNASLREIRSFLDVQLDRSTLERTPELLEAQSRLTAYPENKPPVPERPVVMDIRRLVDIPPFSVPARPWTTVTSDDGLVSHLVSLWLAWCHPVWNCLDRDLFIRDMQAAKLDCKLCSPFLVNCILAEASCLCDYPEVFTVPGDMTSRGAHFYEEAKRLLETEAGRASIPFLQGITTFEV